jgi:hypothetical protein
LVVPFTRTFERIGTRVLIGYDASREAARAVGGTIPLLGRAEAVTVLTIDAEGRRHGGLRDPALDLTAGVEGAGAEARHLKSAVTATISR